MGHFNGNTGAVWYVKDHSISEGWRNQKGPKTHREVISRNATVVIQDLLRSHNAIIKENKRNLDHKLCSVKEMQ